MTPQSRRHSQTGTTHPVRTVLLLLAALLPVLGLVVVAPSASALERDPQITICHATSSTSNPYNHITVDADSILRERTGHSSHVGPVFQPSMTKGWGDVIPAFDYVDHHGTTKHYAGLNTGSVSIIAKGCAIPPVQVELTAPVGADETCDASGTIAITAATGVTWKLDGTATTAGVHAVAPGKHTVTATALAGYTITGTSAWELTIGARTGCTVVVVTPIDPTVVQSPKCGEQGTYTIPSTTGVTYWLGDTKLTATTYDGPATGTITATADEGYTLADPEWSFALDVKPAEACPVIVVAMPEDPTAAQSEKCGVEGSYTIPSTTGVTYLLDGEIVAAGTYDGPAAGTVTARADEGYTLSDPTWSYDLSVAAASACGSTLPSTGAPVAPLAGAAAALLLLGTLLVVAATRRPAVR